MSTPAITDPCPTCGTADHVRWIDSTPGADVWACTSCGDEWTIAVHEPATAGVGPTSGRLTAPEHRSRRLHPASTGIWLRGQDASSLRFGTPPPDPAPGRDGCVALITPES